MTRESKHGLKPGLRDRGSSENPSGSGDSGLFSKFGTDRAVSPIVATIILIALVVVMGGVVASMVFGFGGHQQKTPHAKFTFQYKQSNGNVIVRDTGGSKLTNSNTLHLKVKDTTSGTTKSWSTPVKAGSQTKISVSGGDHVVVDWTGPNGKNTATLGKFNVPS